MSKINSHVGQYVINELLAFVTHKLQWMPPDSVGQLCGRFYEDETVEQASKVQFELCASSGNREDRYRRRQGCRKKAETLKDIMALIQRRNNEMPVTFVALDLSNLPPVSFDNVDVCVLLSRMENMRVEVDTLKATVSMQVAICDDLLTVTRAAPATDVRAALATDVRAAPTTDVRAAPANDVRAAPATDVRAAPTTDVMASPATDVRAAPANDVRAAQATDVRAALATDMRAAPTTDVMAAPATDVMAAPSNDMRAAPTTDVMAAPATDWRAAPANDMRAAPATDARAVPATDMRAAPATDVRAHRHEDRPVLDNWIQVVKKPKREAQGRGRYAMTINGVDAANGHLTHLPSSERPLACIFERRSARLTSSSRD